eukprot:13178670-Heterocapsa_arctica.AAC.1
MAPILAVTKGRSSCPGMLRVCRQTSALVLATFMYPAWRWLPSEHNPGDAGSRNVRSAVASAAKPAFHSGQPVAVRHADATWSSEHGA